MSLCIINNDNCSIYSVSDDDSDDEYDGITLKDDDDDEISLNLTHFRRRIQYMRLSLT